MVRIEWEKPRQLKSPEAHGASYQSDSGIPGTYVPNMSEEDKLKWKGRHVKTGKDPRVEIRKTLRGKHYCQLLIVVRYKGPGLDVIISSNGKQHYKGGDFWDLKQVVDEAYNLLVSSGAYQEA